jgi:hypothetical protein
MSKGSAPTPPNPTATAGAQTSSNVSTAVANAFLNNTNQITPLGSLQYNPTDTYQFSDPSTGQIYSIPRFTATQQLNPQEQSIQDQSEQAKYNLANLSSTQSGRLSDILGAPFDLSGAPAYGQVPEGVSGFPHTAIYSGNVGLQGYINDTNADIRSSFDPTNAVQYGFSPTNAGVTESYGPSDDFSSDRARVEQSLYGRLNPQLQLEQQHVEQQLADQGISYGSPAYQAAMDQYARQANDARLAVTQTAGQEQQRMMEMAAQRAGFQNAAQQQEYQQALGRGQFFNTAQQQAYQQALGRGQFANDAQQQSFQQALNRGQFQNQAQAQEFSQNALREQFYNAGLAQAGQFSQQRFADQNQLRQQALQEQYARRNQPINEISALLSGSQIQQPNFLNTPQNQIPTTDIAGLINQNFAQNFQNYQQQNQNSQSLLGGILGAAGNIGRGYLASDVRVKKDIHRLGTVFAATKQPLVSDSIADADSDEIKKLPIYSYSYKDDPSSTQHIGPMAQDVEKVDPEAVRTIRGVKHINPSRVMGSILNARAT